MSGLFVAVQRLVRCCVGLREVTLPGVHCGTCGKWINEPVTLWRRGGKAAWVDGWGLCDSCATGAYSPNSAICVKTHSSGNKDNGTEAKP